jgi:hypothetical protein
MSKIAWDSRAKSTKLQIPNNKQITMTKIPSSKHLGERRLKSVLVIEYWNLRFVCHLVLGIWDF